MASISPKTCCRSSWHDNRELTRDWDVVFGARGHIKEPHTGYSFGLGTVEVRQYLPACMTPNSLPRS